MEIECVIWSSPRKKSPRVDDFISEFC
jgi:hypothetical protein